MTVYSQNKLFDLNGLFYCVLIIALFLTIIFSLTKRQDVFIKDAKPCCLKGYICKTIMSACR